MNNAAKRIERHNEAWKLVEKGQYLDGVAVFVEAIESYGCHVGLLSDLVATYYLMGRMEDADFTLKRLEQEYEKVEAILSERSRACTLIFLGKMYEEKAFLKKSLFYYQRLSELSDAEINSKIRARCQILRLKAFIASDETLPSDYDFLIRAKISDKNLEVELHHSIMLAELILFGHSSAKLRFLKALENDKNAADGRLIIADYLEECIRSKTPIDAVLLQKAQTYLTDADEFEKFIFELANLHQQGRGVDGGIFEHFHFAQSKMYLFNQIRVLDLIAQLAIDSNVKDEAHRILSFKSSALPAEDRTLIHRKFLQSTNELNSLILCPESLLHAGLKVEVTPSVYKMLLLLSEENKFEIERFSSIYYEEAYSLSHFDRLRTFVTRTNSKLVAVIGTKPLKLTKNSIEWHGPKIISK